ncbi:MAG: NADP-dependent oxidoreductase [Deltaproteobacteria bacterium]|nr:NADP-dependent oxidoreductase [Deltaproteobacteria bacterium]
MSELNRQIILRRPVQGMPAPEDFELVESPIPQPEAGEVLVRTIYVSLDPYMRGFMGNEEKVGQVMIGGVTGQVAVSRHPEFQEGQFVCQYVGGYGWQSYGVVSGEELRVLDPGLVPISTSLGVVGMPGVSAYFCLLEVGKPMAGETVVVSAASGAVGAVAGQIAKLKKCRTVGIAGSREKCDYVVEELGFDAAVNYRTEDLDAELARTCPAGIDVYFDNVGGPILDVVMAQINTGARIALCGSIAEYNDPIGTLQGTRINRYVQGGLARMEGFNQGQYKDRHEESLALLAWWVRHGKLKYREDIIMGLEKAPEAFIGMMQGRNFGKLLIQVHEDPTQDS